MLQSGSGNTWIRFLIEGATGFFTSSVYTDERLLEGGFLGESVPWNDGTTIMSKTHLSANILRNSSVTLRQDLVNQFDGNGVVLIRNPFEVRAAFCLSQEQEIVVFMYSMHTFQC